MSNLLLNYNKISIDTEDLINLLCFIINEEYAILSTNTIEIYINIDNETYKSKLNLSKAKNLLNKLTYLEFEINYIKLRCSGSPENDVNVKNFINILAQNCRNIYELHISAYQNDFKIPDEIDELKKLDYDDNLNKIKYFKGEKSSLSKVSEKMENYDLGICELIRNSSNLSILTLYNIGYKNTDQLIEALKDKANFKEMKISAPDKYDNNKNIIPFNKQIKTELKNFCIKRQISLSINNNEIYKIQFNNSLALNDLKIDNNNQVKKPYLNKTTSILLIASTSILAFWGIYYFIKNSKYDYDFSSLEIKNNLFKNITPLIESVKNINFKYVENLKSTVGGIGINI